MTGPSRRNNEHVVRSRKTMRSVTLITRGMRDRAALLEKHGNPRQAYRGKGLGKRVRYHHGQVLRGSSGPEDGSYAREVFREESGHSTGSDWGRSWRRQE